MQADVTGKSEALIDTLGYYEIPEGVRLEFRLAGPVVRAAAWAIDAAIRALILLVLFFAFMFMGGLGFALIFISYFLLEWFYPVFFEIRTGATPGKKAMGIQVIQDTGIPVTPAASVIRNFLRIADFLPSLYATGLISMMCNREFKRLGDLAAGTLVVYRDDKRERVRPPSDKVEKPAVELCEEDQLTLLAFSERAEELSAERREELAGLLSGVTRRQGEAGVIALYAYANWIIKGR